jgi:hypothetical protein
MARTSVSQSRRMNASPPMIVISRVPSSAGCRMTSMHSSVLSSLARRCPAREPQCRHFRLQASVAIDLVAQRQPPARTFIGEGCFMISRHISCRAWSVGARNAPSRAPAVSDQCLTFSA